MLKFLCRWCWGFLSALSFFFHMCGRKCRKKTSASGTWSLFVPQENHSLEKSRQAVSVFACRWLSKRWMVSSRHKWSGRLRLKVFLSLPSDQVLGIWKSDGRKENNFEAEGKRLVGKTKEKPTPSDTGKENRLANVGFLPVFPRHLFPLCRIVFLCDDYFFGKRVKKCRKGK